LHSHFAAAKCLAFAGQTGTHAHSFTEHFGEQLAVHSGQHGEQVVFSKP